ncbi:MAG: pitrilysin family protein [Steroidobacteraceae bacterium]
MRVLFRLLPFALVTGLVLAAQGPAASSLVAPRIDFEKYRLPNGLEVILVEDRRLPLVAVNLWYHVGPANERKGRTGFAHLFEHMMFQGSKNVPGDSHLQLMEGAGATDLNGTTGFDRTNYYQTLPSNQLELALWLESDRMGFLLEEVDDAKLENQRDVVRNERRQSRENAPYGVVEEALYQTVFPEAHPYHGVIIGSHRDIEAAQLADVREFFKQYYAPNNASLAIVGDIDKARVKALIEKYFGPLAAGAKVDKPSTKPVVITAEKKLTVTDRVELPKVYVAWITPPVFERGDADADLLSHVLGGSKASRLYQKLVYEKQIAQDVDVSQSSLQLGSIFSIEATARPGVQPQALLDAIDAELALLRKDGPAADEIDRARDTVIASTIHGLETLGGVADLLNRYNHYVGDPGYLSRDLARYQAVTPQSVKAFVSDRLKPTARVVVFGVPGEKKVDDVPKSTTREPSAAPTKTPTDWRASQPGPGPASPLKLPVPQDFTLPNGLRVLLIESHQLPVVAANLVVLAGSDRNPADRPGLAAFTADMLDEGTRTRDTLQIARDLGSLGASLSTASTTDYSSVALRALRPDADAAFALMADVALNPAFKDDEIERARKSRLTQLQQQRDAPTQIAQRVFNAEIYGSKHPYGYTEIGSQASLQQLSRSDLESFWKTGYTPANSALIVAGDIDATALRALAQKHFGTWQGARTASATVPLPAPTTRHFVVVDKGKAPQTALRLGSVGVARDSPDYVPLQVMNGVLGGLFSSRINLNLREKNGFTYGASSGFGFRRGAGPFVIQSSVRADATAPAVREIFNEVNAMRDRPIEARELVLSKDSFSRSLPGLFETTGDSASSIGQLFVYGLALDYYNRLPAEVEAVTVADVQRVMRATVDPARLVVVAVGDRATVEPELRKLEMGPVEARTPE